MAILIIMGFWAVILLLLSVFIKKDKDLMLLAGYNTMPEDERNKIDKKELSKAVGNLLLRMALSLALLCAAIYFKLIWAVFVLLAVFIADPIIVSVRMSRKVMKTRNLKKKIAATITILATVIVLIGIGSLFYFGEKEPQIRISDKTIKIEAMYGLDINFNDVAAISLIEKSMKGIGVGYRRNGYGGFGETLKGHFYSDELGHYLLFVKSESAPTIWIQRDNKEDIYMSFGNGKETKAIYQELKAAVNEQLPSYLDGNSDISR